MLRNFVQRLPSMGGSHYVEALRNDPEVIEDLLDRMDREDEESSWKPSGTEWDQQTELLTKIFDQLAALVRLTAAHPLPQGARRPEIPKPHPRPIRMLDKYRLDRQARDQTDFEDEVEQAKQRWREAQARGEQPSSDN
jgi:hypothetical protein